MIQMKIGTIIWRPVKDGELATIEPMHDKGDYCYRINLESREPELISGSEKGLVAITKNPSPAVWTHAIVIGVSKNRNTVFFRFCFDNNAAEYLKFRKILAEQPAEQTFYKNMEPGFRRVAEECMEVMYL